MSPDYDPEQLVHRLPRTSIVDRIPWLVDRCRGQRVVHVGFADSGFREGQKQAGRWLHDHLAKTAASLVGIDTDEAGVTEAAAAGFEVHLADCTDPSAVADLALEPADLVLAGEVIEHVDAPGPFLVGLRSLCRDGGRLIVTTPNAYGLVNVVSNLVRGVEVNHPDHVVLFTWRTLTELLTRTGWNPLETHTYVPTPREATSTGLQRIGARTVLGTERLLGRLGRPFAADGLIVVAEPT